jgi:hypothetical protein
LLPIQLQYHGPVPLGDEGVPVAHSPVVGADVRAAQFELPHWPLTGGGANKAVHWAAMPPLLPAQLHVHGPLPLTAEAVPVLHRLVVGADARVMPLDEPQTPFTGDGLSCAEHEAVVPPLEPAHDQLHGPAPLTPDAVPAEQRLVVGADARVAPLDEPHWPFTGCAALVTVKLLTATVARVALYSSSYVSSTRRQAGASTFLQIPVAPRETRQIRMSPLKLSLLACSAHRPPISFPAIQPIP